MNIISYFNIKKNTKVSMVDNQELNKMFFWDDIKVGVTSEITTYNNTDTKPISGGPSPANWAGYPKITKYKVGIAEYKEIISEYIEVNPDLIFKEKTTLYKDDGTELVSKTKTYTYNPSYDLSTYTIT